MSEEFLPLSEASSNHFSYLSPKLEGPIHPQTGDRAVFTCQAAWVNHSCHPNAGLSGQIVLVARDDIAVGVEVCYDYAMREGHPQAFQPY